MDTLDGDILDFLGTEPKKVSSISTYLNVDRKVVNSMLYVMLKEGKVNKVSHRRTLLGWIKLPTGDVVLVSDSEEYSGSEGETVIKGNDALIGFKFCELKMKGIIANRNVRVVGNYPTLDSLHSLII